VQVSEIGTPRVGAQRKRKKEKKRKHTRKFIPAKIGMVDLEKRFLKSSVDKKNQLDVTFCILYFSSNRCSTCFGQPCAHHQELTTA